MNNTAMPLSDPGEFQEDDKEEIEGVKTNFLDSNSESDTYRWAMCYEEDFEGLFEDLDLGSSKLGKSENQKNELIAKVLTHLDEIDFQLDDTGLAPPTGIR